MNSSIAAFTRPSPSACAVSNGTSITLGILIRGRRRAARRVRRTPRSRCRHRTGGHSGGSRLRCERSSTCLVLYRPLPPPGVPAFGEEIGANQASTASLGRITRRRSSRQRSAARSSSCSGSMDLQRRCRHRAAIATHSGGAAWSMCVSHREDHILYIHPVSRSATMTHAEAWIYRCADRLITMNADELSTAPTGTTSPRTSGSVSARRRHPKLQRMRSWRR